MSKQSNAKEKQGYVPKAIPQTCGNCRSFCSTIEQRPTGYGGTGTWSHESNLHCGIGMFAVKKMGRCDLWQKKDVSTTSEKA